MKCDCGNAMLKYHTMQLFNYAKDVINLNEFCKL